MSNRMKRFAISMASPDPEMPALEFNRILLDANLIANTSVPEALALFLLGLVVSSAQYKHSVSVRQIGSDTSGTLELDGILLPMGPAIRITSKEYGQNLAQIGVDTDRWYLIGNGESFSKEELMAILAADITIALIEILGSESILEMPSPGYSVRQEPPAGGVDVIEAYRTTEGVYAPNVTPARSLLQPDNRGSQSQRNAPSVLFSLVLLCLSLVTFLAHLFVMTTFFTTMFGMYVSRGKVRWLLLLLGVGVMVVLLLK
jgi:hypothetical protein